MEILQIENLSFSYPDCEKKALNNITFEIKTGEFVLLTGTTGSGKTTLLRMLKPELKPYGKCEGSITYFGKSEEELTRREAASRIGFVMQKPEHQTVSDKVWSELAFGLENTGADTKLIRMRVAETASYFGIEDWFDKDTAMLSGGQKQLLALASVMTMHPEVLILDEPTAMLDPIAAAEFVETVARINRETGITVIMTEHALDKAVPFANRIINLKNGTVVVDAPVRDALSLLSKDATFKENLPAAVRLYGICANKGKEVPLNITEGRTLLNTLACDAYKKENDGETTVSPKGSKIAELKDVYYRYEKNMPDVIKGLNLDIYENEILGILGGNGSGKSTLVKLIGRVSRAYAGRILLKGQNIYKLSQKDFYDRVTVLPQDAQTVFLHETVREELKNINTDTYPASYFTDNGLFDTHPYDLSGGEQELLALAKCVANDSDIIILDEPTKGLDAENRAHVSKVIGELKNSGKTVIIVTHDTEWGASVCDRLAMLFKGEITSYGTPGEFFKDNYFYTTPVSRLTRGIIPQKVTFPELEDYCKKEIL